MTEVVAIVGKAAGGTRGRTSRDRLPVRSGVERWLIGDPFQYPEDGPGFWHWDRWFDVHTKGHILKHRPDAWRWYQMQGSRKPIYLLQTEPSIAGSVAYPLAEIQQAFAWGGSPEEYFTSSVDWMIALAILEGVPRIELYGVDMFDGHERKVQREGACYWVGMARGRGIDVMIPDVSSLTKTERLYGYQTPTSPRNFASMSLRRFLCQVSGADQMKGEEYVAPGVDESAVARRESA